MTDIVKRQALAPDLPKGLADLFGDTLGSDDLSGGVSPGFAVLSIKGKTFHIKQGGVSELVRRPDDGEPAGTLEVVLVKASPHVSKTYYKGGYVDGSDDPPTCASSDGIRPDAESPEKQSSTCAACKWNQFGSRLTDDGRKAKACGDNRRVAIGRPDDIANPILLRVPAASLKALAAYGKELNKRGVPYQAVITKLSFDHDEAYPKLVFKPARIVTDEQGRAIKAALEGDIVEAILSARDTDVAAPPAAESDENEAFEQVAQQHAAKQPVAQEQVAEVLRAAEPDPATPKPARKPRGNAASKTTDAADAVGDNVPEPTPGLSTLLEGFDG